MALNNPAARLHNILTISREHKANRGKAMVDVWRSILSIREDADDMTVMNLVAKVFLLPEQVATEIGQYEDLDKQLYLGWRNDLSQAFKQISFSAQFAALYDRLSDSLLINIKFCAHELTKRRPEKMIDEAGLDDLKDHAYALYKETLESHMEPNLRRYILDHTYEIVDAIDSYLVTGACPLQKALDASIGTAVTDRKTVRDSQESDLGKRFWDIMGRTGMLLNISNTVLELSEGVSKLVTN